MLSKTGGYIHPDAARRMRKEQEVHRRGWNAAVPSLRSLPGIPSLIAPALEKFAGDAVVAAQQEMLGGVKVGSLPEICGAFVVWPTGWTLGGGWTGEIRWLPLDNSAVMAGTFSADTKGLVDFVALALERRRSIAEKTVQLSNWWKARWMDVEEARMSAWDMSTPERSSYMSVTAGKIRATGLDTGSKRLSAFEYLMLTGPAVLAGFGHSHPNVGRGSGGSDGLSASPEDLLHVSVLETWRRGMSYTGHSVSVDGGSVGYWETVGYMGLSPSSECGSGGSEPKVGAPRAERKPSLEKVADAGNWICGVRNGHWAGVSRYSERGMLGRWTV